MTSTWRRRSLEAESDGMGQNDDRDRMLVGCSLSPGYGSGTAYVYHSGVAPAVPCRSISPGESEAERRRFTLAIGAAQRELTEVRERVLAEIGEAESEIIGAHLALLTDPTFIASVERRIQTDSINAELALEKEADAVANEIRDLGDEYPRTSSGASTGLEYTWSQPSTK
jgi:phosphoenolpyruvate-protein phosphotransferase (PTS system enzyme I)